MSLVPLVKLGRANSDTQPLFLYCSRYRVRSGKIVSDTSLFSYPLILFFLPLHGFTGNDNRCDDIGDDPGATQAAEHNP